MMKIIDRFDAYWAVIKLSEKGDIKKANAAMKILSELTVYDKENKTYSKYLELKTDEDYNLFMNAISDS